MPESLYNHKELKVGDMVEVVDAPKAFVFIIGIKGVITAFDKDGSPCISVKDDVPCTLIAPIKYLRKLPDTISFEEKENPLDKQIGGNHYSMPIQPIEFIERNGLGFSVGNCIKYLCRYKQKNGKEDLLKARHYIDLLIHLEYPE